MLCKYFDTDIFMFLRLLQVHPKHSCLEECIPCHFFLQFVLQLALVQAHLVDDREHLVYEYRFFH